jgi:type VII secretion protein EccE
MIRRLSARLSTGHLVVAGVLITAAAVTAWPVWLRALVAVIIAAAAVVTFDDRRASDWLALGIRIRRSHQLPVRWAEARGSLMMPGEDVALRWEGDILVALIALHQRPFTPTYAKGGRVTHDDSVSTALVREVLSRLDVPATADIVSAGWRVSRRAPLTVYQLYEQTVGADPCPAARRTWLLVRVDPHTVLEAAAWRSGGGMVGVAAAAVSAATRLAEALAARGIDARVASSFADYDQLTDADMVSESWSHIRSRASYTTVFSAPGGPERWWAVRADRTVTRMRLSPGQAPRSTVTLTTVGKMTMDPPGWTRLRGGQLGGLSGSTPVVDTDWEIPIGSAGMLVGNDPADDHTRIYLPLDAADAVLHTADPRVTVQVALRSTACGASIWLPSDPAWARVAAAVGASTDGRAAHLLWPSGVRTWLVSSSTSHIVQFLDHEIVTEDRRIPVNWVHPREEVGLVAR